MPRLRLRLQSRASLTLGGRRNSINNRFESENQPSTAGKSQQVADQVATTPSTFLEKLAFVGWSIVQDLKKIHPNYRPLFGDEKQLASLLLWSDLDFTPGFESLFDKPTPPPLSFSKDIPFACSQDLWGVYLLILKKDGDRPRLYIGSGTATTNRGLVCRLQQHYNGRHNVPSKVMLRSTARPLRRPRSRRRRRAGTRFFGLGSSIDSIAKETVNKRTITLRGTSNPFWISQPGARH